MNPNLAKMTKIPIFANIDVNERVRYDIHMY